MSKRKIFSREFKLRHLDRWTQARSRQRSWLESLGFLEVDCMPGASSYKLKMRVMHFLVTVGVPARMRSWLRSRQRTSDCGRTMRF